MLQYTFLDIQYDGNVLEMLPFYHKNIYHRMFSTCFFITKTKYRGRHVTAVTNPVGEDRVSPW